MFVCSSLTNAVTLPIDRHSSHTGIAVSGALDAALKTRNLNIQTRMANRRVLIVCFTLFTPAALTSVDAKARDSELAVLRAQM
jgi:hypothetical protein